jgi:hypothetical protein
VRLAATATKSSEPRNIQNSRVKFSANTQPDEKALASKQGLSFFSDGVIVFKAVTVPQEDRTP